ncbi:MFS transporter [Dyadobacter psychrotolerans]|uniref:MFS transporter n=1 Tax=Dyadobacter psychrotolerans TaxID=2541721 RepID=A0A4R5E1F0_9BACT|nr:MFS transporter [Dyadobacter psychrotolerans]TDE17583.1 MFS transporter [Dyadobacter psychrotolerans]
MNYSIFAPSDSRKYLRIAVAAFFFVQGLSFAAWASRIPDIKNMLHLTEGGLGTVLLALPIGLMASLPISGWMVTHYGSKKMVLIGAILYAVTLAFIGFVTRTEHLVIALFAFGLWGNLTNIAVNTQAVAVEQVYGKSIMASFHGLWSLAGFISAMIGSLFISVNIPPQIHFSVIALAAFIIIFTAYKHTMPDQEKNGDEAQPMFVKPDKDLLMLGLIGFCAMVCEGAMFDWSGVYFQEAVKVPASITTLGYVAFMGTMTGGRFAGDWLANRIGRKKMLQLSGLFMGTGLAIAVVFPFLITATLGFLLVGFGVSSVVPLVYSAAGRSTTMKAGMALAAVSSISFIGFLIGPPLIGIVAQFADLRWSFAIVGILGSLTAVLSSRAKLIQ